jgi:4-hydroxy-tetrahydrodipicolinate synthase
MAKKERWENIFPAICIPLNDDYSVNEGELRRYVRWLADIDGIDGLVCNGHTGEITSFNPKERAAITRIVASEVGDRVAVISGVSAEGTAEAIEHARDAQEAGAAGILLMPPHTWLRFGMKQEAVVRYFRDIAEAIDIGIVIHLYPFGTKAFYPVETVVELSRIPNVKTLKMGTRHMALYERDVRILRRQAPGLTILTCMDEFLLSSMYVGVDGALIGFGSCIPELITEAWKAVQKNEFVRTRELQEQIFPMAEAIYGIGEPSGDAHARMKEALKQRGVFSSALMRPPLLPLAGEEKAKVTAAIRNLKQPRPAGWERAAAERR